jgi:hypothetical protein
VLPGICFLSACRMRVGWAQVDRFVGSSSVDPRRLRYGRLPLRQGRKRGPEEAATMSTPILFGVYVRQPLALEWLRRLASGHRRNGLVAVSSGEASCGLSRTLRR